MMFTGTSHGAHHAPARAAAPHAGAAAGAPAHQASAGPGGKEAAAPGDAFSALMQSLGMGDGGAADAGQPAAATDAPATAQPAGAEGQAALVICPAETSRPTVQLAPPPGMGADLLAAGRTGPGPQGGPMDSRTDGALEALAGRAGPVSPLPVAAGLPLAGAPTSPLPAQPAAAAPVHGRPAAAQQGLPPLDDAAPAVSARAAAGSGIDPSSMPGEAGRPRPASREVGDGATTGLAALAPAPLSTPQPQAALPSAMPAADRLHQGSVASHPMEPAFAGDLASHVRLMAGEGLQHAELRLHPVDLGPVHIRLVLDGPTADIQFAAVHATTRQGLEQALPQLRAQLADAGLQLGQAGVGTGLGGGQGQPAPPWPQPEGNPGQPRPGRWRELAMPGQAAESRAAGGVRAAGGTRARGLLDLYA